MIVDGVTLLRTRLLPPAHHARQRFDERRILITHVCRNEVSIAFDDPLGNANVLA